MDIERMILLPPLLLLRYATILLMRYAMVTIMMPAMLTCAERCCYYTYAIVDTWLQRYAISDSDTDILRHDVYVILLMLPRQLR